jgi:hypothetical protein
LAFLIYFAMKKSMDSVHVLWTTALGQSTMDPHGGMDGKPSESGRPRPVLTMGGQEGEGRCGGLATGLTGARGAAERSGDSGEVAAVVELNGGML